MHATILHLQRLSTEDGPGIRTTVFFKGCSLRCGWCHNPESLAIQPQVQWLENRCIGCLTCRATCPKGAILEEKGVLRIAREICDGCGMCKQACPANAMELLGQAVELDALVGELGKDRAYYMTSGGGVTASGGEPTLQPDFTAALFARLKAAGIHTALDTCGLCSPAALGKILQYTDLVLFDLKEIDSERHRRFTGQGNERILANLRKVGAQAQERALALWVRTPLIPGATATNENLVGIGALLASLPPGSVTRWELCAFNNLCRDKYRRLDLEWEYAAIPLLTQAELDRFASTARGSGVDPQIVVPTGMVRSA